MDIRPPLTIIYVGNGCEVYSNNLYIPAKSELTSRDDTVVRHNYFQQFNEKYQNLTKYSLIEDLGIEKLTNKEIENLPDRLAALPTLRFNELKRRLVEIKKPLHIHSNTVAILLLIGGIILTPCLAYILWRIYVVPQRSWGDRSDTDHSKCLLLGGRRLNLLTVIPKPKGSGGARAATAQIGPANERNKTK